MTEAASPPCDEDQVLFDRSIAALIFHLSRGLATSMDRQLAPFNITSQQAALLLHSCEAPDATPTQIAPWLGTDNAGITRLLDRLHAKGLVVRRTSATDRRVIIIEPTAEGRSLVPHLLPVVHGVTAQLLNGFDAEELPAVHALLLRLLDNVERCERGTDMGKRLVVRRRHASHDTDGESP
jgi:DNA-binding MarR family transcriptional regulator